MTGDDKEVKNTDNDMVNTYGTAILCTIASGSIFFLVGAAATEDWFSPLSVLYLTQEARITAALFGGLASGAIGSLLSVLISGIVIVFKKGGPGCFGWIAICIIGLLLFLSLPIWAYIFV